MSRRRPLVGLPVAGVLVAVLLTSCSEAAPSSPDVPAREAAVDLPKESHQPERQQVGRSTTLAPEPRRSHLRIPALGLRAVPVVRYRGSPDDARGTRIQNQGPAASPRGTRGGVGPGEVGNFIVTGHRVSHAAPFRELPSLQPGDEVRVRTGAREFVYRIVRTRWTSFRSQRSLIEQSAAVPGRPDAKAVRPMITLSTCATPEDHAAGNYWSDRFGNPEHRIDKIGVLVASRGA